MEPNTEPIITIMVEDGIRAGWNSMEMADAVRKIRTVAVYCGSNEGKSPVFAEKAAGKPFNTQSISFHLPQKPS